MRYTLIIDKPKTNHYDPEYRDRDFSNVPPIVLDFVHSLPRTRHTPDKNIRIETRAYDNKGQLHDFWTYISSKDLIQLYTLLQYNSCRDSSPQPKTPFPDNTLVVQVPRVDNGMVPYSQVFFHVPVSILNWIQNQKKQYRTRDDDSESEEDDDDRDVMISMGGKVPTGFFAYTPSHRMTFSVNEETRNSLIQKLKDAGLQDTDGKSPLFSNAPSEKFLAFSMGGHNRLGRHSHVNSLHPDTMRLIHNHLMFNQTNE